MLVAQRSTDPGMFYLFAEGCAPQYLGHPNLGVELFCTEALIGLSTDNAIRTNSKTVLFGLQWLQRYCSNRDEMYCEY